MEFNDKRGGGEVPTRSTTLVTLRTHHPLLTWWSLLVFLLSSALFKGADAEAEFACVKQYHDRHRVRVCVSHSSGAGFACVSACLHLGACTFQASFSVFKTCVACAKYRQGKNRLKPRNIEFIRTWGDPRVYGDAKRRVSVRLYVYVLDLIWYMCGCMSVGACVGFQAVL